MMSGAFNLLKGLRANWYGQPSEAAATNEADGPPSNEEHPRDCLAPIGSPLSDSYVQLKAGDAASDNELSSSDLVEDRSPATDLGPIAQVSGPPVARPISGTAVEDTEGPSRGVGLGRERANSRISDASSREEDEDGPLDDYVQIDSSMHHGHVDMKSVKQGWMRKQVFHVVDGRPDWRRHFARWKQRYFVLGSDGCLRYYADEGLQKFRRSIPLAGMEVTRHFYASESTEESGRCFIIRPKQRPQARRRSISQRDQHEEETKFLSNSPEEMEEWLRAIQAEIDASEEQGQTIFKAAWGSLKSLFLERQKQLLQMAQDAVGGVGGVDADMIDFVHVPSEGSEEELLGSGSVDPHALGEGAGARSRDLGVSDLTFATPTVPIPRMSIVIMVVGTQGDVQPFVVLGRLLQRTGHRVRLATHELFRPMVAKAGLEFFPLGGDPKKLSAFMVKTSGRIFPKLYDHEEMTKDVPEQMAMLTNIIRSTWPACTAPDPDDPAQLPFLADAIISNPVTYGHIHCAEALSVPLHIMFPQPWSPTKAFPHPLSGLPYSGRWCKENYYSYIVVDKFLWFGMRETINAFRADTLGLDPIRLGEHGGDLLNHNRVPFAKLWSPALVPKPKDWGPHIDVVGNVFGLTSGGEEDAAAKHYTPPPELEAWLCAGSAPIFVGFGSMVIEDTQRLVDLILDAALRTRTRVLLQSSWSTLHSASQHKDVVLTIGAVPHDWLMPRMAAVIHHGGAGTVAAGLRAAKPTMVCPFFGDQFFWGYMIHQAGVGVRPVPVTQLSSDKLAEAFLELKSPRLAQAAQDMAKAFASEDGAKEAVKVFYRHLPVEDMVCDVSLFTSRPLVARRYCATCRLKLSLEADALLHATPTDPPHQTHDYCFVNWGVVGPQHAAEGLMQGLTSATHEVLGAVTGMVTEPVAGAHKSGVRGAAKGVAKGLINLVRRPIRGGMILVDKVSMGVSNSLLTQPGPTNRTSVCDADWTEATRPRKNSFYENVIDMPYRLCTLATQVVGSSGSAPEANPAAPVNRFRMSAGRTQQPVPPVDEAFAEELRQGYKHAQRCRELFLKITKGNPSFVTKDCVLSLAEQDVGGDLQPLHKNQFLSRELLDRIDSVGDGRISFQQFCVFFKALHDLQHQADLLHMSTVVSQQRLQGEEGEEEKDVAGAERPEGPSRAASPSPQAMLAQALDSRIYDSIFLDDVAPPTALTPPLQASVYMEEPGDKEEEGTRGKGEEDVQGQRDVNTTQEKMAAPVDGRGHSPGEEGRERHGEGEVSLPGAAAMAVVMAAIGAGMEKADQLMDAATHHAEARADVEAPAAEGQASEGAVDQEQEREQPTEAAQEDDEEPPPVPENEKADDATEPDVPALTPARVEEELQQEEPKEEEEEAVQPPSEPLLPEAAASVRAPDSTPPAPAPEAMDTAEDQVTDEDGEAEAALEESDGKASALSASGVSSDGEVHHDSCANEAADVERETAGALQPALEGDAAAGDVKGRLSEPPVLEGKEKTD